MDPEFTSYRAGREYREYRDGHRDHRDHRDYHREYRDDSRSRRNQYYGGNNNYNYNKGPAAGAAYHHEDNHTSRSPSPSPSTSSDSIDDTIGHIMVVPGKSFQDERYVVQKELGIGTFGKVLLCEDRKHKDAVAIKVVRKIDRYIDSAKIEASILSDVFNKQRQHKVSYFVKMYSTFEVDGHYFMVFEPLGKSLYDVVKSNGHVGFPMSLVRTISRQLLEALHFLESIRLIHTDLKMENVLFYHTEMETIVSQKRGHEGKRILVPRNSRIKIIDFGGATYDNEKKSSIVNTRQYRGPEVTMELGWSYPSDIWSAACIIAEMYTGDLLFATHDDLEHLCIIERMLGYFPHRMIRSSPVGQRFFHRDDTARTDDLSSENYRFVNKTARIQDIFSMECGDADSGIVSLMYGLLNIDPGKRFTASYALRSPFFHS